MKNFRETFHKKLYNLTCQKTSFACILWLIKCFQFHNTIWKTEECCVSKNIEIKLWHLRFPKKVSALSRCPLYKVLDFFEEKHHIRVVVTGKRVNSDIGLGLEILVDHFFHGNSRVSKWFRKFIEKFEKRTDAKMKNA